MKRVEHRFIEVAGLRLHYAVAGAGSTSGSVPVVLIHGLNNSLLTWKRIAPILARDRTVLMLDLPGHGQSARPDAGYELDWYARVIAQWLARLGVEQADVVGHSFGGGIAQTMLLYCRNRIRRLVLVAAGGLGRDVNWLLRLASVPRVVEWFGQPIMAVATRWVLGSVPRGVTERDIQELSELNARPGTARAFARTVRDVIDLQGQRRSFFDRAHKIPSLPPIAVFWGDRDTLIPFAHGKAFADLFSDVVLRTFSGCGHYLHNERPRAFTRALRAFLDDPAVRPARPRPTSTAASDAPTRWTLLGDYSAPSRP